MSLISTSAIAFKLKSYDLPVNFEVVFTKYTIITLLLSKIIELITLLSKLSVFVIVFFISLSIFPLTDFN